MTWLWLLTSIAGAQEACSKVSIGDLTEVNTPAVVVLGERKGTLPDLARAAKVVRGLQKKHGPVTLALHAVHRDKQVVLDQLSSGALTTDALEGALEFQDTWGFSIAPYLALLGTADDGVKLVAVGGEPDPRTEDDLLPLPPGYIHVLTDTMGEALMPIELEARFVQRTAWIDQTLAARAMDAWDEQGVLVIVADRMHVEGGKGVSWQAQRLTDARVHASILAWSDTPCYPGDQLLP